MASLSHCLTSRTFNADYTEFAKRKNQKCVKIWGLNIPFNDQYRHGCINKWPAQGLKEAASGEGGQLTPTNIWSWGQKLFMAIVSDRCQSNGNDRLSDFKVTESTWPVMSSVILTFTPRVKNGSHAPGPANNNSNFNINHKTLTFLLSKHYLFLQTNKQNLLQNASTQRIYTSNRHSTQHSVK